MTKAPPSFIGAAMLSVAVPSNPIATDVIDGETGGPSGRCHKAVVVVLELQVERVRIMGIKELLLMQVVRSISFDPGVPDGADPF